jgi:hypothetical protein
METFDCECCHLEHANRVRQVAWEDYTPPTLCRECIEHRGKSLQRAEDHAREYHRRMEVAIRAAHDAHDRAAEYKAEAQRAFNSRERALEAIDDIARHHQRDEKHGGCSCGKRDCPTLRVLSDPWVAERLVDYSLRDSGKNRTYFHSESGERKQYRRRDSAG